MEARRVIALLRRAGHAIEPIGPCDGGATAAAYYVRTTVGERILKWQVPGHATPLTTVAETLDALRERGCPVARYTPLFADEVIETSLQEILPGGPRDRLTVEIVRELHRLNAMQSGLGETGEHRWAETMLSVTRDGGVNWCRHDSLESHSTRTRELWERVLAHVDAVEPAEMNTSDVVHCDFHHRNVLQSEERVTGVIDWEGVQPGDRNFDLVTLAFYSGVAGWDENERLRFVEESVSPLAPGVAALYLAHLALRSVDWAIRNETEDDVERWLAWSEPALALVD